MRGSARPQARRRAGPRTPPISRPWSARCWAADTASRAGDIRDPGFIVIDEVAAQFLVLAVAPVSVLPYAAGFVLFRIADIVKPFPANWADREVHGGLGIMLDDIFAALYAGPALFLLVRFGLV